MAAFATSDELRSVLQLSTIDVAAATELLDRVSDSIRQALDQDLDGATGDTVTLDAPPDGVLLLPEVPVTAVSAVALSGTPLVEGTDYTWSASGILRRLGTTVGTDPGVCGWSWGGAPRSVTVTYDHGWAPDSRQMAAVAGVCLQVAARVWSNPRQAGSEDLGDWSTSWSLVTSRAGILLTDAERAQLDRLRTWP